MYLTHIWLQCDKCVVLLCEFGFTYNKLDYISKLISSKGKLKTDFQLWIDCINRKKEALDKMQLYCDNDVLELEQVYLKLRPYMTTHPNLGVYCLPGQACCPTCLSTKVNYRGYAMTKVNRYKRFQCQECGSWGRERYDTISKAKKKNITVQVA